MLRELRIACSWMTSFRVGESAPCRLIIPRTIHSRITEVRFGPSRMEGSFWGLPAMACMEKCGRLPVRCLKLHNSSRIPVYRKPFTATSAQQMLRSLACTPRQLYAQLKHGLPQSVLNIMRAILGLFLHMQQPICSFSIPIFLSGCQRSLWKVCASARQESR